VAKLAKGSKVRILEKGQHHNKVATVVKSGVGGVEVELVNEEAASKPLVFKSQSLVLMRDPNAIRRQSIMTSEIARIMENRERMKKAYVKESKDEQSAHDGYDFDETSVLKSIRNPTRTPSAKKGGGQKIHVAAQRVGQKQELRKQIKQRAQANKIDYTKNFVASNIYQYDDGGVENVFTSSALHPIDQVNESKLSHYRDEADYGVNDPTRRRSQLYVSQNINGQSTISQGALAKSKDRKKFLKSLDQFEKRRQAKSDGNKGKKQDEEYAQYVGIVTQKVFQEGAQAKKKVLASVNGGQDAAVATTRRARKEAISHTFPTISQDVDLKFFGKVIKEANENENERTLRRLEKEKEAFEERKRKGSLFAMRQEAEQIIRKRAADKVEVARCSHKERQRQTFRGQWLPSSVPDELAEKSQDYAVFGKDTGADDGGERQTSTEEDEIKKFKLKRARRVANTANATAVVVARQAAAAADEAANKVMEWWPNMSQPKGVRYLLALKL
jgi:hypothetical protein